MTKQCVVCRNDFTAIGANKTCGKICSKANENECLKKYRQTQEHKTHQKEYFEEWRSQPKNKERMKAYRQTHTHKNYEREYNLIYRVTREYKTRRRKREYQTRLARKFLQGLALAGEIGKKGLV